MLVHEKSRFNSKNIPNQTQNSIFSVCPQTEVIAKPRDDRVSRVEAGTKGRENIVVLSHVSHCINTGFIKFFVDQRLNNFGLCRIFPAVQPLICFFLLRVTYSSEKWSKTTNSTASSRAESHRLQHK